MPTSRLRRGDGECAAGHGGRDARAAQSPSAVSGTAGHLAPCSGRRLEAAGTVVPPAAHTRPARRAWTQPGQRMGARGGARGWAGPARGSEPPCRGHLLILGCSGSGMQAESPPSTHTLPAHPCLHTLPSHLAPKPIFTPCLHNLPSYPAAKPLPSHPACTPCLHTLQPNPCLHIPAFTPYTQTSAFTPCLHIPTFTSLPSHPCLHALPYPPFCAPACFPSCTARTARCPRAEGRSGEVTGRWHRGDSPRAGTDAAPAVGCQARVPPAARRRGHRHPQPQGGRGGATPGRAPQLSQGGA